MQGAEIAKARKVYLFVGTQKGAFIFSSGIARKQWALQGPMLKGAEVNDMIMDTRGKPILYACASAYWWGSTCIEAGTAEKPGNSQREESSLNRTLERKSSGSGVSRRQGNGEPLNKNVLADFKPEKYPEAGQCVHHLTSHPSTPGVLYQQNHCGVYRSDNEGKDWTDISKGLPSRFGFPMQIHPHDPDTVFVIPEQGGEFRASATGRFTVYRSPNGGKTWEPLTKGLPGKPSFLHVHRQAMAHDEPDQYGLYVGASNGQIFWSRDNGDSWRLLAEHQPQIFSLNGAVA